MRAGASVATGRAAAMERRRAVSQGKRALPPATERVRTGFREAALPAVEDRARPAAGSGPATPPPPAPAPRAGGVVPVAVGRSASMLRREALSRGKAALVGTPVAAAATAAATASPAASPNHAAVEIVRPSCAPDDASCRALARARRAELSRFGRGSPSPTSDASQHRLRYAPRVVAVTTDGEQRVTGIRIGHAARVTGLQAGLGKPVSGTPYIGPDEGATTRRAPPKIGLARTEGGQIVSGTLVRSRVAVTGDESGERVRITGEADPRLDDDLTPRERVSGVGLAQFQRQADPHGHSVFGSNLGRSARSVGSRSRERERPLEVTVGGRPVTGTAVGRSPRVTGDEPGACRALTGTQYLAPARAVLACEPAAPAGVTMLPRPDPVTGGKVRETLTWRGQRVTGPEFEQEELVTGSEPGTCSPVTGTPYQGPISVARWCAPRTAGAIAQRLVRNGPVRITGDVPLSAPERVSGIERGADRFVSGTPYYEVPALPAPAGESTVPAAPNGFSITTPHRQAMLEAPERAARRPRITGSFAIGEDKVTGQLDFGFRPRLVFSANPGHREGERPRITGEGRTQGFRITGDAWRDDPRVTGTEGTSAAVRNPSRRDGERKPFAHSAVFKARGRDEPPRKLVTGVIGWTPKSAAIVTLSGGAQG